MSRKTVVQCSACSKLLTDEVVHGKGGRVTNKHIWCPKKTASQHSANHKSIITGKKASEGPVFHRVLKS